MLRLCTQDDAECGRLTCGAVIARQDCGRAPPPAAAASSASVSGAAASGAAASGAAASISSGRGAATSGAAASSSSGRGAATSGSVRVTPVHARLLRLCTQHDAERGHLYPRLCMSTLACSASVPNPMPSVDTSTPDSACPRSTAPPLYPTRCRAWTPLPPTRHVHARLLRLCTQPDAERGHPYMHAHAPLSTLDEPASVPNPMPSVDTRICMHMHPCPRSTNQPLYPTRCRAWTPLPPTLHVHAQPVCLCTQYDAERGHPLPYCLDCRDVPFWSVWTAGGGLRRRLRRYGIRWRTLRRRILRKRRGRQRHGALA